MPGWHEKTLELQETGKLAVLGITEEQHADRSELFMRWKQMEWPVLVDSFNLLGVSGVPSTWLIDEFGVIRYRNPKTNELTAFLETDYEKPTEIAERFPLDPNLKAALELVFRQDDSKLTAAIGSNTKRLETDGANPGGQAFFHHGVLHRMRYDSAARQPGDFAEAIRWWGKALEANPGQYIWRRRIQQYGPRLDKPYPFYDWVETAQNALIERGEKPIKLVAALSGAEIARPESKTGDAAADTVEHKHPDPENKLPDDAMFVNVNPVVVPATGGNKSAARVHLNLTLNHERLAHWNNESDPPVFWPDPSTGLKKSEPVSFEYPDEKVAATSIEDRSIELEVHAQEGATALPEKITGRLFYYVCEGEDGTCLFLSRRVEILIR